ncbi:hypothetical protein Tco_1002818 [Tanacetum coccineum]|uniref:Uncharacterized protein n=1 Tax=Tanacetum coccineum TaxID=301880 RepID=A0ABQ5F7N9_9ASTR
MVRRRRVSHKAHDQESQASHQFRLDVYGNCPHLEIDHGCLQFWVSIIELLSEGTLVFVRTQERLICSKKPFTTFTTINLHEMAYASPICLMARATSTKSCLQPKLFMMNIKVVNRHLLQELLTAAQHPSFFNSNGNYNNIRHSTAPTKFNLSKLQILQNTSQECDELETQQHVQTTTPETIADNFPNKCICFDENTFVNPLLLHRQVAESSSSQYVESIEHPMFYQTHTQHEFQWTEDHPLEQVIRNPLDHFWTRNQLRSDGDMYADYADVKTPSRVHPVGAQFLGEKLVSWSSKKQDCNCAVYRRSKICVSSFCCAQVLWMADTVKRTMALSLQQDPIYCDS